MTCNKGDIVVCVRATFTFHFSVNATYIVREDFPSSSNKEFIRVKEDDTGNENGLVSTCFVNLGQNISKLDKLIFDIKD